MLKIIAGRSGSGKTEAIHRLIQQNARKRAIVLLVPEQSSFQNEKGSWIPLAQGHLQISAS